MKAIKVLSVVVVGSVMLGGCSLFPSKDQVGETTDEVVEEKRFSGGIKDMLALGQEFKCETQVEGQTQISFIKNGQYYSEMNINGQLTKTIIKDQCMWAWQDGGQGTTMCFEQDEQVASSAAGESENSIFDNENAALANTNFSCEKTNVSDEMFDLPSEVKFTDVTALINAAPAVGTGKADVLGTDELPNQEELDKLIQQFGE